MDPTKTHSQEPEGDFTKITQCSNPAGDEVDHPSADELTSQTDGSLPQVSTEDNKETKFEETSSEDDRSEIGYDAGKNGEDEHLEKDKKESWSSVEDKKGPEDVLKEIQMQKTHGLYCPNCTHTITGTAELFEKGQETLPYNNERFIFVIVLTFKYPFIYLRWLYNNSPEPVPAQPEPLLPPPGKPVKKLETNQPIPPFSPKGPVIPSQPIPPGSPKGPVEPNQPNPLPPKVPSGPKPDNTSDTLLEKIRDKLPNRLPRLTPTSQRLLLLLVLLLLSVILLLTLAPRPSPPPSSPPSSPTPSSPPSSPTPSSPPSSPTQRPIKPGNSIKPGVQPSPGGKVPESQAGKGGGVSSSWLTNFLSNNYISIILLLFLAILAVLWRSMIEGSENDPQENVAATDCPKLDNGTDQEIIPEEKPEKNENHKEDPSNKEGDDTSKDSASSTKLLPIKLDILKSIVYGGLIESITSFGVVSSAAASGTSTLNVLALGLANLFTGFFIIIHNLYGLFKRPRYQSWNNDHMTELVAVDPYEELLGKRNRVILHCFVVLVSFIFFAVIPPLFYGFSFKITDKAPIFAAASLLCVISLSFAKAYAFGMDKVKTVAVHTGIALCGSSLSCIASQHATAVFAKYDFHKLAADYLEA